MEDQVSEEVLESENQLEIDPLKMQRFLQEIRDNQNLVMGSLAGLATAIVCAILWAVITAATNYQIGWMAIGVGVAVGSAVRYFGKGIDTVFGISGGFLSFLGCLAGNFFTVLILVSNKEAIPILELLGQLNLKVLIDVMKATFQPMDAVFYAIGLYEGYNFSFRQTTDEELAKLTRDQAE